MRAGVCAAQQTLSAESASVLKHSLGLARRRGHAQVTPLHVAATLLSPRASLLRRACLKSQPHQPSHPLQCRALELCFNVALNRLPATPGPLHQAQPSLSNALVAALKRAQAHQRRGCIEQQQPPLIAIKVELEQLILSILDDPSVSRVMREAGFSSTSVKNNLEDCNLSVSSVFHNYTTSGGIYSTPNSPPIDTERDVINPNSFWRSHNLLSYSSEQQNLNRFSPQNKPVSNCITAAYSLKEDINLILEVLVGKKRRNTVIVGDSLHMPEKLVWELMGKVEKGDVPEDLKSAKLIKFRLSTVPLRFMKREEVDTHVTDLKRKVESFASSCGKVIIYIGDLQWTVDSAGDEGDQGGFSTGKESSFHNSVDHLIAEIGKLLSWYNRSNMRVWLMAIASYQTYMKCQMKRPPLDAQWALQAVSVPSGGLGLSLNATSGRDSRINLPRNPSHVPDKKLLFLNEEQDGLTCCPECISSYEKDAGFKSFQQKSFSQNSINKDRENGPAQLPHWLKTHGNQTLEKDDLVQLRRKYNKLCQSLHHGSQNGNNPSPVIGNQRYLGTNYYYASSHPCWSNQNILADTETISFAYPAVKPNQIIASPLPQFGGQQPSCHIEFSFSNESSKYQSLEPNLNSHKSMEDAELKITLALGNYMPTEDRTRDRIGVYADICDALKENVPWQSEKVPLILEALMDSEGTNQDKFLLIQGNDVVSKRRLAVGIAKSIFGSSDLVFSMNMRNNTNTVAENCVMVEKALRNHENVVILVEDVDYADSEFAKFLADGFEAGKLEAKSRHKADSSGRAILILTMDSDTCNNNAMARTNSVIQMKLVVHVSALASRMPNHDLKRKVDWDMPVQHKSLRSNEMEEVSSNGMREFTRQLISNALDLNIRAEEDETCEGKPGQSSPITSDLTRETTLTEQHSSLSFLKKIKNCCVFNRNLDQEDQAREMFLSKFKRSFKEACGCRNTSSFDVEEMVLEEVLQGSGLYLNSLFEEWLKDIFQTSLKIVNGNGERKKVSVRLCLEGKGEGCAEDGFMGTRLPQRIPVSFIG